METAAPKRPRISRNAVRLVVLVVAAGILGALLASRPSTDPEAMAEQVRAYAQENRFEDALRTAQDALDIVKNGGYPDEYVAKFYLLRGQMWHQVYEWDSAQFDFDEAIALAPDYPEAYYLRGLFYANLSIGGGVEQLDLAIADFETVVALDPDGPYATRALAAIDRLNAQKAALEG